MWNLSKERKTDIFNVFYIAIVQSIGIQMRDTYYQLPDKSILLMSKFISLVKFYILSCSVLKTIKGNTNRRLH